MLEYEQQPEAFRLLSNEFKFLRPVFELWFPLGDYLTK